MMDMKSVLEVDTRQELITRIGSVHAGSQRQWGTMNVVQMLKHCVACEKLYFGEITISRSLLGRVIGTVALKNMLKDESPMGRNAPTSSSVIIAGTDGDVEAEKRAWVGYIERYALLPEDGIVHWFFGRMSAEQIGQFVYKHADHHLRQFGC